jgi:hypothetical protein
MRLWGREADEQTNLKLTKGVYLIVKFHGGLRLQQQGPDVYSKGNLLSPIQGNRVEGFEHGFECC